VPLRAAAYPEPSMFGLLPASGIYARHVEGLLLRDVQFDFDTSDDRPLMVFVDLRNLNLRQVTAPREAGRTCLRLHQVDQLTVRDCPPLPDFQRDQVEVETF